MHLHCFSVLHHTPRRGRSFLTVSRKEPPRQRECWLTHRTLFKPLAAHIPLFLYPFLNTVSKTRPFEYLRLTSLGVIGALVKVDDADVINFLLSTEIIPLCLRIMETGDHAAVSAAFHPVLASAKGSLNRVRSFQVPSSPRPSPLLSCRKFCSMRPA